MKDYGRRGVLLAAMLSALAGYVDAVGFMTLGGFFVSFMSGNTTRLGVAAATGAWDHLTIAAGLIVLFIVGVIIGSIVARQVGEKRRAPVLATEAALLIAAAAAYSAGHPQAAMIAVVLAMGVENAVFQRQGDVRVGLTYMTGALVRMGQRIVTALHGGPRWDWVPYLLLWMGLCAGAGLGAASFIGLGHMALWIAAMVVVGLTISVALTESRPNRER